MRFSRTRLLTAAQHALDEARTRQAARVAEWDAFIERDRAAWVEKNREKVTTAGLHALGITGSVMTTVSQHLALAAPTETKAA